MFVGISVYPVLGKITQCFLSNKSTTSGFSTRVIWYTLQSKIEIAPRHTRSTKKRHTITLTIMTKKISHQVLTDNLLPDIVIERTLEKLPRDLKVLYLQKKATGTRIGVGLDMQLGFYLLEYQPIRQVELLWWENKSRKVAVA